MPRTEREPDIAELRRLIERAYPRGQRDALGWVLDWLDGER